MTHQKSREIIIAVLPFQILKEQEGLSPVILGFTEDLIINFSKFIGLSVISQYSIQHIKDLLERETIDSLGTDYIVTGSFRTLGENVRIGVQLIRTVDYKVVFARQYDETLASILQAQDTVTQQIVSVLQQQIDYDLLSYSYKNKKVQLAAYENYLMGMDSLEKGSPENDRIARSYFEAALKIDPQFARAYTGISLTYFNVWSCQMWERWDASHQGAHEYAQKALELDENDYVSLAILGRTYLYSKEYEKAEHCLRKSYRMNPNDAKNLIQIAFPMVYLGYFEEAEKLYIKAISLNPLHPDSYFAYGALIYLELGQFETSLELAKKVPTNLWVDLPAFMAAACYHLSDLENMHGYWKVFLSQYKAHIPQSREASEQEAANWLLIVNPYKGKTKLHDFLEYITGKQLPQPEETNRKESRVQEASFIQKNEIWELSFQGKSVQLKDARGLHDIVKLLSAPEQAIHCNVLMGTVLENSEGTVAIDQKAKAAYQKRIRELQTEIQDAEEMNNSAQAAALQEEYEWLLDHLSQSLCLAGKAREVGSSVEKARSAVTWRIRSTIKKIEKVHPPLAKHLSNSVHTGTFCAYKPERPIHWIV